MKGGLRRPLGLACALLVTGCSIDPVPITTDQVEMIARHDRQVIFDSQEQLEGPLTLEHAIAMALKYNLENRVRLLEETVAYETFDLGKSDLMPQLAANAGYISRDKANASFSTSLQSGNVSLEPSTSQDDAQTNADIGFTWNLLDFGVSYLQAKQDADRYLIAQKAQEKVMLTLMQEVRAAYWRAVAMEAMKVEFESMSRTVESMLDNLRTVREEQLKTPVAVLLDIRALIETTQQLDQIRRSINTAQTRVATLVNVPSYSDLTIEVPESFPKLPEMSEDVESMELLALARSSDYTSEIYKVRIEQRESRKAMLRILPGLEFNYSSNYNANSFLVNQQWGQVGANLTGDLMRLFNKNRIEKFRDSSEQLSVGRKLAVNMAVIAGVHITWQDYKNSLVSLDRADLLRDIDDEISLLTQQAESNRIGTGVETIQNDLRAFRSKMSQMQSYADAQASYGALLVSLGLNPIPKNYQRYSINQLAEIVLKESRRLVAPLLKDYQVEESLDVTTEVPATPEVIAPDNTDYLKEFLEEVDEADSIAEEQAMDVVEVVEIQSAGHQDETSQMEARKTGFFGRLKGIFSRDKQDLPQPERNEADVAPTDEKESKSTSTLPEAGQYIEELEKAVRAIPEKTIPKSSASETLTHEKIIEEVIGPESALPEATRYIKELEKALESLPEEKLQKETEEKKEQSPGLFSKMMGLFRRNQREQSGEILADEVQEQGVGSASVPPKTEQEPESGLPKAARYVDELEKALDAEPIEPMLGEPVSQEPPPRIRQYLEELETATHGDEVTAERAAEQGQTGPFLPAKELDAKDSQLAPIILPSFLETPDAKVYLEEFDEMQQGEE